MKPPITLATLSQATAQEVFDQVATHLLTQMERSRGENKYAYRSASGLKCAAGCLIGDDEYNERFEEFNWIRLVDDWNVSTAHKELIQNLQRTRDDYEPFSWHERLKRIADYYDLVWNH